MSKISRYSDDNSDKWFEQLESNLSKQAVQPKRVDDNLFNQINSIIDRSKSKFKNVADKVKDMQSRSGLTDYLEKINKTSEEETNGKVVSAQKVVEDVKIEPVKPVSEVSSNTNLPDVIVKFPQLQQTLENYIRDSKGNYSIPSIISKMKSIHFKDIPDNKDWDDEKLIRYISQLNLHAKAQNPTIYHNYQNLGKRDDNTSDLTGVNDDALAGLMPARVR